METEHPGTTISAAMRDKAATGEHMNRTPLGYRRAWEGYDRKLVIDEPTASLIKAGFQLVTEGRSIQQTLVELTARGLRNRKGIPLSKSSLHTILTNPFYTGKVHFQGREYNGTHAPVVDAATFRRVQVSLGHNRR